MLVGNKADLEDRRKISKERGEMVKIVVNFLGEAINYKLSVF